MLPYLLEDLMKNVIPVLERLPDEEKECGEKLCLKIDEKIQISKNAYDINTWYGTDKQLREEVVKFLEHDDPRVAEFGGRVKWLLTKAPYFYTDD